MWDGKVSEGRRRVEMCGDCAPEISRVTLPSTGAYTGLSSWIASGMPRPTGTNSAAEGTGATKEPCGPSLV